MNTLLYMRLISFTAGTLLQLFWMVVILGYRRQRNFERVFFFLSLALFFFYAGSLLALNAQIYYVTPRAAVTLFAWALQIAGLCFLPSLLVHLHLEFASTRGLLRPRRSLQVATLAVYAPVVAFALRAYSSIAAGNQPDLVAPGNAFGGAFGIWFALAMIFGAWWQSRFLLQSDSRPERLFHLILLSVLGICAPLPVFLHVLGARVRFLSEANISILLAILALVPFAVLVPMVQRHNFLHFGRQKNLIYAVSATFLALLYLAMVRRVGTWLEPLLPPEASAAVLLFVLVIFIEPLQRILGRQLRETAQREMDRVQQLSTQVQLQARQGDLRGLIAFIEHRVKESFELAGARLTFLQPRIDPSAEDLPARPGDERFSIHRPGRLDGILTVQPHGAMLSGELRAAFEFLCESIAGAIDLCVVLEEKLQLERELAERERLALVGQTAASISHNLKNPLGSIKTILQVQLENPEMPESMRGETKMVLEEISRLSSKLNQLLQFSRPAVRGGNGVAQCDARAVVEEVAAVLRHEAERKGIVFEAALPESSLRAASTAEALSDIASNLVVNALEATPDRGHVRLQLQPGNGCCVLTVEDNGPGIPPSAREKILQPFFTTKSQGTGLGLAIVARRVSESGGKLEWESPLGPAGGTRFQVRLPQPQ